MDCFGRIAERSPLEKTSGYRRCPLSGKGLWKKKVINEKNLNGFVKVLGRRDLGYSLWRPGRWKLEATKKDIIES